MLNITEIRDVKFVGSIPGWMKDGVMALSPYCDKFGFLVVGRGYEQTSKSVYASSIFQGYGKDPFTFSVMGDRIIGPSLKNIACEDPTFVTFFDAAVACMYSDVREIPRTEMARRGKSAEDLGVYVALKLLVKSMSGAKYISTLLEPTQQTWWTNPIDMCKEGEVILRPTEPCDILFYEFCDCERSRIAVATVDMCERKSKLIVENAQDSRLWLDVRPGKWDSDHVSTGPIVDFGDKKLMFYNGRNENTWAIGEVVFDPRTLEITYRSDEPIITPPPEVGWAGQYIAFSSGVLVIDGVIYLYHHIADKRVRCAVGTF